MKCPKCNCDIDEKMLVCPGCKKVLKLVCPKCDTINKGTVCKKCGFTIISKCHSCSKINQTISAKCSKCGFSTYKSVAISTSSIDEFACLLIKFPNLDEIKLALGSTKLFEKFKMNLEKLILDYTHSVNLTREFDEDTYIIKFNKDFSFADSANFAMKGAIDILNSITQLNFKLSELKDVVLQCNIAVLKRDINSVPKDFNSGFDIKLIYQGKNSAKLLNCLQVIADSDIYGVVCDNFDLSSLSSTFVKNKVVMLFELNIKKYVKIPQKPEGTPISELSALPVFDEEIEQEQDDLYSVDLINFEELKFDFVDVKSVEVITQITKKLQEKPASLISVRAGNLLSPRTIELLKAIEGLKKFKNIYSVACHNETKYGPYSFFREFISIVCNFSKAPKRFASNDFEILRPIDTLNCVENLVNAKERKDITPEEFRNTLFDVLYSAVSSLRGSLIFIDNFDKIDDSSYELMQFLFEKFDESNISYVLTVEKDFSLNKKSHFLLSNPNYTEMLLEATPFKEIVEDNPQLYKEILKSHYIEKIAKNSKGSVLYVKHAIDYLIENGSLEMDGKSLTILNTKNVFIPPTLDELVSRQLTLLSKDVATYKFLLMLVLLGPSVDIDTINLLEVPDVSEQIKSLKARNFIFTRDNFVFVNNYNIYKNNLVSPTSKEFVQKVAAELLEKIISPTVPSALEPVLYSVLEQKEAEISSWQRLSKLNNSLGDYSGYLNCIMRVLRLDSGKKEVIDEAHVGEIYENVSNLLHRCPPEKIHGIVQIVLDNLERSGESKKIVDLCYKMLQGYLYTGNYQHALDAIRKILANFPYLSFDPYSEDFNLAFFNISLMKLEILFSLGKFKDCVEAASEILDVINPQSLFQIKPEALSMEEFENIIFESLSFAFFSKVILLDKDVEHFADKIKFKIGRIPQEFELFMLLLNLLQGRHLEELPQDTSFKNGRLSKVLFNIIRAFNDCTDDYKKFASQIHSVKTSAKAQQLFQIELLCDLLIGYSYFKLSKNKKASAIYNSVLEASEKNSLKLLTQMVWYFMALLKLEEGSVDIALGLANNATVQIERDSNSSDYLLFLFKKLMAAIFEQKRDFHSAQLCINNARFIKDKYGLSYEVADLKIDDNIDSIENTDDTDNSGGIL